MKIFIILLSVITFSGCYKPALLYNHARSHPADFCIQLTEEAKSQQNIYQITGGRDDKHIYDKHYYYYHLSDYLKGQCWPGESFARIEDAKVGLVFQTYGKGRSYLKLVFGITVGFYKESRYQTKKTYHATSQTEVMTFIESNKKQAQLVSKALANGYQDILQQIDADVKRLK